MWKVLYTHIFREQQKLCTMHESDYGLADVCILYELYNYRVFVRLITSMALRKLPNSFGGKELDYHSVEATYNFHF